MIKVDAWADYNPVQIVLTIELDIESFEKLDHIYNFSGEDYSLFGEALCDYLSENTNTFKYFDDIDDCDFFIRVDKFSNSVEIKCYWDSWEEEFDDEEGIEKWIQEILDKNEEL